MGLSTKQVSCDGLEVGWGRQAISPAGVATPPQVKVIEQQQKQDPLKCPRCASTNTKFCYYNNYNRSQPRHFCKSCRRHWTQGGTLREIPVGGGRKNRRLKSSTNNPNSNSRGHHGTNTNVGTRPDQELSLSLGSQKNHSETLNKSLLHPSSSLPLQFQAVRVKNCGNSESDKFSVNSNNFMGSYTHSSICNFPFTKSSTFDSNPPSISVAFPSSDIFSYSTGHAGTLAEPITTTVAGGTNTTMNPYWQFPVTSSFLDWTSNWSWDDLTTLVSTDFKQSWDDSQNESQGS